MFAGPQPETQSEVHQQGGTHCDVSDKLLKGWKDKVVTSERHCAGSAAIKRCFRITRLQESAGQATRVLWRGARAANQRPRCHSSLVTSQPNARMISNYRFREEGMYRLECWAIIHLPVSEVLPALLSPPSSTANTIHNLWPTWAHFVLYILSWKCIVVILWNRQKNTFKWFVLRAATEVGMTSGSRSRRRRQPSYQRTSRCRKRRSRPSPERTNSSHHYQVSHGRAAVKSPDNVAAKLQIFRFYCS